MICRQYVLLGFGILALAGSPCMVEADAKQDRAPAGSLKEETYRGIRYVTGGIGEREQQAMKELAKDYDVFIVLSSKNGAFLSGAELTFRDQEGREVLLATSRGPYFLIDLPEGRYEIEARRPSAPAERQQVEIHGGKTQHVHFRLSVGGS